MNYVFLISEATSKNHLWLYKDIEKEPNVSFISSWGGNNIITKIIRLFLIKLGKLINVDIIKRINGRRLKIKPNKNYCIVIEAGFLAACNKDFYSNLREHKNVKIFLLLVDAMSAHSPSLRSVREQVLKNDWDEVFTFEKDDAEKYGWNYSGVNCSSLPTQKKGTNKNDLYFVGGLKGERSDLLFSTYDLLVRHGISCKYDLWYQSKLEKADALERSKKILKNFENEGIKNVGKIALRKHFLKYRKTLSNVQASNVIFEVVQKGQSAQTMRWFEAIYYNKKLLTNNPNIIKLPFYNEKYMKYVTCADDIDVSWILSNEKIDYGYNGEISPVKLLKQIREKAEYSNIL